MFYYQNYPQTLFEGKGYGASITETLNHTRNRVPQEVHRSCSFKTTFELNDQHKQRMLDDNLYEKTIILSADMNPPSHLMIKYSLYTMIYHNDEYSILGGGGGFLI